MSGHEEATGFWSGPDCADCKTAETELTRTRDDLQRALNEVAVLKAELEQVKADSKRLDWLNSVTGADWFSHCDYGEATRAAIDEAMKGEK